MKNTVNNVSIDVLIKNKSVQQFTKDNKYFIIGYENENFELILKNDNSFRVLAIIGIDGLNTIDGNQNTKDSPGFVIERYGKIHLKGYQINDNECASFKFVCKNKSYSTEKLAQSAQNGVISVDIYKEYEKSEPIIKEKEIRLLVGSKNK